MQKKVAVVMGSDSDLSTMQPCLDRLRAFSIPFEVRILSAHRHSYRRGAVCFHR